MNERSISGTRLFQSCQEKIGKLGQVGIRKGMLVMEEVIVHLPEFALCAGGLDCQSRVQRVGMDFAEREVAIDEA